MVWGREGRRGRGTQLAAWGNRKHKTGNLETQAICFFFSQLTGGNEDNHDDDEEEEDAEDEEEEDDDEDAEDEEEENQRRYDFRQRKTVVRYQAPLDGIVMFDLFIVYMATYVKMKWPVSPLVSAFSF